LEAILARKDTERQLGAGTFFWGIGTALGDRVWSFIDSVPKPKVIFSRMSAPPKRDDIAPKRVVVWSAFFDRIGQKHAMPPHVLVTSRAPADGNPKRAHFALICRKKRGLLDSQNWPALSRSQLTNFSADTGVACSQVTAIVELRKPRVNSDRRYEVLFVADLVPPYYVKLADPVEMPRTLLAEINDLRYAGES
jgi:hypothetical protein